MCGVDLWDGYERLGIKLSDAYEHKVLRLLAGHTMLANDNEHSTIIQSSA